MSQSAQSIFSVTIIARFDTIVLDNDDILDCYFIEDIYSYLMTGKITMTDTAGLSEFLPLVGNEQITITYGTNDQGTQGYYIMKEMTFDIVKLANIESIGDKHTSAMDIFFIQKPHKRLHMENYSKSYKCMTYIDMIMEICAVHCGIMEWGSIEPCDEELQYFYTGLKTPAQCIEWLGSRCSGIFSGQPGYLLFSNTKREGLPYNLVTLESLLMSKTLMLPDAGQYTIAAHNEFNINKIQRYKDNRVDKQGLGSLMKGIGMGYDMKRKRYLRNIYTYTEALERFTSLGLFSLFSGAIEELLSVRHELTAEVEEELIMKNLYFGDWIKRYCLQHTVDVVLEGHSSRHAGGMIEIQWPSASDDEVLNKSMSGLYLVKSVTHSFTPSNTPVYMQKMILIKNGYDRSDGDLSEALKPNINAQPEIPKSDTYDLGIRGL